jgi:phosphoglycerol transferase
MGTWEDSKLELISDKKFVEGIEETLIKKENIQIVQFPYMPYPENGPIHQMRDYEQIYGYLHSKNIHWSYGAIKGRESDYWYKDLIMKPINLQIKILEAAGFSGIVINRNGYADNAQAVEQSLRDFLHVAPIVSDNQKLAFFKLNPRGHTIIMPPFFNGFYEWEGEPGTFRWAGDNANILWINNEAKAKEQTISFEMGSLVPRNMSIRVNGEELDSFTITPGVPSPHSYTVKLVPGRNTIEFVTPEPSVKPGGMDTRDLSFSIAKFHAEQDDND